jgi:hypothetical protein
LSLTRLLLLKDAHESLYTKQAQQAMAVSDPAVRLQALNNLYKRLRGKDQVAEAGDAVRTSYPQLPGFFDGVVFNDLSGVDLWVFSYCDE